MPGAVFLSPAIFLQQIAVYEGANSVFVVTMRHEVCRTARGIAAIGHGNAYSCSLEHAYIVLFIAKYQELV